MAGKNKTKLSLRNARTEDRERDGQTDRHTVRLKVTT